MSKITLNQSVNFQNETTAANTINNNSAIVQSAFDNTLSRDGTTPNQMNANLDMNSNRILNLAAPVSSDEPARLQDLADLAAGHSVTLSNLPTGGTTGQVLTKNSSSNYDASWATPSGGGGGGGGSGSRILLTGNTTFYVSTTGSDTVGDGSAGNPWRTRGKFYSTLSNFYDLGGYTVTCQLADGVYTDSLQAYGNQIVGQNGAGGIIFNGNSSNPANVVIRPALNVGYAYGCAFGASFTIQNQTIDMINGNADGVAVGQDSNVIFGPANPGPSSVNSPYGMIFMSPAGNGYNMISGGFKAFIEFAGNIKLMPSTYTTTGTWTSGTNSITLASTAGITPGQFMGIEGTGIGLTNDIRTAASSNYITSVSGNVATLAYAPSVSGSNVIVTLTAGGQAFLDLGGQCSVYWNTNGDPNYSVYVDMTTGAYPFFSGGFFYGQGNCYNNAQAITFNGGTKGRGPAFAYKGVSVLDTNFLGTPYIPGNPGILYSGTWSAGATTINVGAGGNYQIGNTINSYFSFTSTFSAGATTISMAAPLIDGGAQVGMALHGPGITEGTVVLSVGGGNCTISHPTYSAQTNVQLTQCPGVFAGPVSSGTYITAISGTTVGLSQPAVSSGSGSHLIIQPNILQSGSFYI